MKRMTALGALVLVVAGTPVVGDPPRPRDPVAEKPKPNEDDALQTLLAKSDVVVTGEFTSVAAASTEAGVNHYWVEVKIDDVIKGDQKSGAVIELAFVRVEPKREDALPILKEKSRAVLFLKKRPNEKPYAPADRWLGVQHPHAELLAKLRGLVKIEVPVADRFCGPDDVLEVTGGDKSGLSAAKVIEVLSSYRKVTREQYLVFHHLVSPNNKTRQIKLTNGKAYTLSYEPGYAATLRDADKNETYLLHPTLNVKK